MSDQNYRGPGVYRHFKGHEYEVFALGADEKTLDDPLTMKLMVAYRPVDVETRARYDEAFGTDTILLDLVDFNESVEVKPGMFHVPRFTLVGPPKTTSDPAVDQLKGWYEACRLLLTSPRFNKAQREVIEEVALGAKEKLEARGVVFGEAPWTA